MNSSKKLKTIVMLSGSGSTLQNFIDLSEAGQLPIDIKLVISSKPNAYGLERAKKHHIDTTVISPKSYPNWTDFNQANVNAVNEVKPDLILLAGYLSLFIPDEYYVGKIMNTHPALIPAFCGKGMYGHRVHQAVIESGVKISGATIHFVDNEYDAGPIITQKSVPVYFEDTPESLAEKVQAVEREIYPQAILLFAENRLNIQGRRVQVLQK